MTAKLVEALEHIEFSTHGCPVVIDGEDVPEKWQKVIIQQLEYIRGIVQQALEEHRKTGEFTLEEIGEVMAATAFVVKDDLRARLMQVMNPDLPITSLVDLLPDDAQPPVKEYGDMEDYIQKLHNMATEIVIKPHNSNIPSPVTISAHICIKQDDGLYQYAKLQSEAGNVRDGIVKLTAMAEALQAACNPHKESEGI